MVTGPGVDGSVNVTEATPDELVIAMTLLPLVIPLETVPAEVVNSTLAPASERPEGTLESVTLSACGRVVPAFAV